MTLSLIGKLLATESGHENLSRQMDAARADIDRLAMEKKGVALVGNMQEWTQDEALPIIVEGINIHLRRETKHIWKPYND